VSNAPHSSEHFGEQRDFWWHKDFLDLMARRWKLAEASSLADIGCGLCHWSRLLYPYLREPARLAAIDREKDWVARGRETFRNAFPEVSPELLNFAIGDATSIPLLDESFEVVTCQTVLMHLEDPRKALREMVRILRPGGVLICAEPNNLWNYVALTSLTPDEPVDRITRRFEFWVRYHRGKLAEGKGDHSIGDLLPGYFQEVGLDGIQVYQSDRAASIFPPYASREQQALIAQEKLSQKSSLGSWDREEVRRQVLRGGGSPEFFESVYAELILKFDAEQGAIRDHRFHAAFGSLMYLVSGRKT
jgi:SAM-dependent methyltransferase